MRITVMGATGLIGSRVAECLRSTGHDVVAASRSSGVDAVTGAGLTDALAGASVLVDVTNAPSSGAGSVMSFFTASATNLVEAAMRSGVGHYVVLSIVGVDGLPDNDYFQAKVAQERIVAESAIPYSIVRATQFVEFTNQITASLTDGDVVRVPDALIQPIPADEVAAEIARVAVSEPLNGIVDIGGPAKITCEQMARDALARSGDTSKTVVVDPTARYFGAALARRSLVTAD
jgi:uncharacterized protein YbjT (DUF2867 family)